MRRLIAALCALALASAAQAQAYRPGALPGFRPGFQFLAGATCPNASLAYYDFVANTGCSAGVNAANSTANLTVSRASIGYDLAATTQFAANVARRTGAGLLVEGARTNLITNSGNMLGSGWQGVVNGGAAGAASSIATQNAAGTAPDGVGNSYTINLASGSGQYYLRQADAAYTSGAAGAWTVYAKRSATTPAAQVRVSSNNTAAWNTGLSTATVLTSSWQRVGIVGALETGGSSVRVVIGNVDVAGNPDANCVGNVDIAFAQLETGVGLSSYTPTTTSSATRAADNITLQIPSGADTLIYTFDDGSQQYATVTPGSYTIPTNLRRPVITAIQITSSLAYYDFQNDTARSAGAALSSSTSGLTVSRASIGYDLAATIQFAANVARRTSAGLLVENAATNLISNSQDVGGTNYGSSGVSVTRSSGVAPDGSNKSSLVAFNAGTLAQIYIAAGVSSGSNYVFSTFQKGASGGEQNNIYAQDNANPYTARGVGSATLSSNWQRVAAGVVPGNASTLFNAGTNSGVSGATTPQTARSIYTTFWQVELGTVPSSYIPTTTAAATRAADNITLTLPSGTTKVDLAYDNSTTNTVSVSAGSYTIPANPASTNLKSLRAY